MEPTWTGEFVMSAVSRSRGTQPKCDLAIGSLDEKHDTRTAEDSAVRVIKTCGHVSAAKPPV